MPNIPYGALQISDNRGKKLVNFIEENNMVCLNKGNGTRLNYNGSLSHLDISLCNSKIGNNLEWMVFEDCWSSDHFPTMLKHINELHHPVQTKYFNNKKMEH